MEARYGMMHRFINEVTVHVALMMLILLSSNASASTADCVSGGHAGCVTAGASEPRPKVLSSMHARFESTARAGADFMTFMTVLGEPVQADRVHACELVWDGSAYGRRSNCKWFWWTDQEGNRMDGEFDLDSGKIRSYRVRAAGARQPTDATRVRVHP